MDDKLYDHIYYARFMRYWEKKQRIGEGQGTEVSWTNHGSAIKGVHPSRRQWAHKHFCGCEGTNYMLFNRRERNTPTCPNCERVETHRHVVNCQSNRATVAYRNIERNFESWLKDTTSTEIRQTIMAHLNAYREDEEVQRDDDWGDDIILISEAQSRIGPNAFAEGLLTPQWIRAQGKHLKDIESKKNPSRWMTELIRKLWNVSWDMWESRNGEVHKNKETRKTQIIAALDTDIRRRYSEGQTNRFLPMMERRFFSEDIEEILKHTEYQKRAWLLIAKRYIERDRQRVARSRSIRIMREWLIPGSTGNIGRHCRRIINRRESDLRAPEGSRRGLVGRKA